MNVSDGLGFSRQQINTNRLKRVRAYGTHPTIGWQFAVSKEKCRLNSFQTAFGFLYQSKK
jgi:hypothetical protein